MRIIIEDTDPKVMTAAAAASFSNSTTPGTMPPIDAGAPSASLMQTASTSATSEATDAGTPPESLVQALQNSSSINNATSNHSTSVRQPGDAGAAPTA